MTIWTDLQAAIEAKITAMGFTGTLDELQIDKPYPPTLLTLLALQASLYSITGGSGGGGGDASAANQTSVQANAGSDASKAIAVQGITNGKAVPISASSLPLPTGAATSANQGTSNTSLASIDGKLILPASLGAKTAATSLAVTLATDGVASGIDAKIGEVQATPTANTVLARLKAIADALVAGIKTAANSFSIGAAQEQFTETQLTAPSSTTARSMVGYRRAFIQVLIGSINTSVTLRVEGSNDGTNWSNLSSANSDTVITANGTQSFNFEGCPQFIRTTFVSETGGTAATIDVITRVSA